MATAVLYPHPPGLEMMASFLPATPTIDHSLQDKHPTLEHKVLLHEASSFLFPWCRRGTSLNIPSSYPLQFSYILSRVPVSPSACIVIYVPQLFHAYASESRSRC